MFWKNLTTRFSTFWTLNLAGWLIYGLTVFISFVPVVPSEGSYLRLFEIKSVRAVIGFGISLVLRQIYRRLWSKGVSLFKIAVIALFCSVFFGCAWLMISRLYSWAKNPSVFNLGSWSQFPADALDYSYVLFGWSACYFGIKYWQDFQGEKERAIKASALAHQAQLDMLRYQLNPHFLFNALNSIRASIDEDPRRAKSMITEFSEFLRYSLLNKDSNEMPLKDELEAVKNYLAIEKIRFEERLEVEFHIDSSAKEYRLPGFLIHPLVENAIKHGMQSGSTPLKIRVAAQSSNNSLRIEVANTGKWIKTTDNGYSNSNGTGTGLENIRRRLEHAFPGRSRFHISEADGWVSSIIEIDNKTP
jgi:hypothetical protein